jgi:hypothetical protein
VCEEVKGVRDGAFAQGERQQALMGTLALLQRTHSHCADSPSLRQSACDVPYGMRHTMCSVAMQARCTDSPSLGKAHAHGVRILMVHVSAHAAKLCAARCWYAACCTLHDACCMLHVACMLRSEARAVAGSSVHRRPPMLHQAHCPSSRIPPVPRAGASWRCGTAPSQRPSGSAPVRPRPAHPFRAALHRRRSILSLWMQC